MRIVKNFFPLRELSELIVHDLPLGTLTISYRFYYNHLVSLVEEKLNLSTTTVSVNSQQFNRFCSTEQEQLT